MNFNVKIFGCVGCYDVGFFNFVGGDWSFIFNDGIVFKKILMVGVLGFFFLLY